MNNPLDPILSGVKRSVVRAWWIEAKRGRRRDRGKNGTVLRDQGQKMAAVFLRAQKTGSPGMKQTRNR